MFKNILIKILKVLRLYKRIYLDSKYPCFDRVDLSFEAFKLLYIDISSVVLNDLNAGIQRSMKIILQILTEEYSNEFLIVPIYFYRGFCYCSYDYSVRFNNTRLLNYINNDKYIENFEPNSIFLSIDINFFMSKSKKIANWLKYQKQKVLCIKIIHDLIPILTPEFSEEAYAKEFAAELKMNSLYFDMAVCVSKTVMKDYQNWLINQGLESKIRIDWIHWGANIDKYKSHYVEQKKIEFRKNNYGEYFLMVSTIEPKKGYDNVIDAFDILWGSGYDKSLVIVGKEGFKTRNLIHKIKTHPLLNKKLFWLNSGISDTELIALYNDSIAFIMASYIEGFGLGVVEAAKYHKPLIIRNIPVFHEIAGDNAYYFSANNGNGLAHEILEWTNLYKNNLHIKSDNLSFLSWEQSCDKLIDIIMKQI